MENNKFKVVHEYALAVNFLVDNLEMMIEDEEFDIDKLNKRIEVVKKFKGKLDKALAK